MEDVDKNTSFRPLLAGHLVMSILLLCSSTSPFVQRFTRFFQLFLRALNIPGSEGCKMWVAFGNMHNSLTFFSFSNSGDFKDV